MNNVKLLHENDVISTDASKDQKNVVCGVTKHFTTV